MELKIVHTGPSSSGLVMHRADVGAAANVRTVRRLFKALTTGDVSSADEFVSPRYVDHEAPATVGAGSPSGPAQFRASVQWFHRVFADVEFDESEVIAVGDRVVVRGTMGGRHVGALLGIAPMGKPVRVHQVHLFRLADDQVVEHRALWGELSLLAQIS